MGISQTMSRDARARLADTAADLLIAARQSALDNDFNASDALVVAVLRVLDGYEAVAQLPDAHDIASEPDKPIPFHPVR